MTQTRLIITYGTISGVILAVTFLTTLHFGNMDNGVYAMISHLGAMLSVALAWFVGSLGGTFAACRIGSARPLIFVLVVGGMMVAGAIFNLTVIPHPIWFSILGIVGIFIGTWLGMALGARKDASA